MACSDEDDVGDASAYCIRPGSTRFVGRVQYDGAGFRGWQDQDPRLRTVQGTMNRLFRQRFARENVHVTGSSRTDFGVHAKGQAFHFDLPDEVAKYLLLTKEDHERLAYTMNRMLPDDIKIYNVTYAPIMPKEPYFHAIASAVGKHYSYTFSTNAFVEPHRRKYCTHVWRPMDMELFARCLDCFVGVHDFNAFANRIEHNTRDFSPARLAKFSTRRKIFSISLSETEPGYHRVDLHLESALYRMVRNVVGTSLLVAEGKMPFTTLQDLLIRHPSRAENKAKSAPPEGLCLERVYFAHF
jgi:tRNA pseudouridine38-40 synthase